MLADVVEVVIGVDTHKDTHTAAVMDARTGAVLDRATVSADLDGYQQLLALAGQHPGLRAWAMEGSGGYGAGLARHLSDHEELVVELDRPVRPKRRAGAKSDPIDLERAARDVASETLIGPTMAGMNAVCAVSEKTDRKPRTAATTMRCAMVRASAT
jgi:transposase